MAAKIRQNDEIIVLAGKDKGKRGKITRILTNGKAIVEGVNLVKKHQKPNPQMGVAGGSVEQEASIQISNISLVDANGKASRVGFRLEDGKKVRFFKSNNELV